MKLCEIVCMCSLILKCFRYGSSLLAHGKTLRSASLWVRVGMAGMGDGQETEKNKLDVFDG